MLKQIPQFLNEKLLKQYGQELTNNIITGYSSKRKTSIRVNTVKTNGENIKRILNENNIKYTEVEWSKDALILEIENENIIKNLDIYNNGEIYMQSLSSMIPAMILSPKENENILDMAAAPGGKTTQMAAMSFGKAYITACEKNKIRFERLKYNIEKQGVRGASVLLQDARKLDDYLSFDKILLDAPCSGSGTISLLDDKLEQYFTEELIDRSIKVQYELLKKATKILKPGHEMIYSTCSILKEENEDNLIKILKDENIEIVPIENKFLEKVPMLPVKLPGTICICPNELYEGFFVAKLRKK